MRPCLSRVECTGRTSLWTVLIGSTRDSRQLSPVPSESLLSPIHYLPSSSLNDESRWTYARRIHVVGVMCAICLHIILSRESWLISSLQKVQSIPTEPGYFTVESYWEGMTSWFDLTTINNLATIGSSSHQYSFLQEVLPFDFNSTACRYDNTTVHAHRDKTTHLDCVWCTCFAPRESVEGRRKIQKVKRLFGFYPYPYPYSVTVTDVAVGS